ncbi:MAG: hypothetical protein HZC38_10685 [Chloroflexi bacterium]|nr:hypothetical protein [Chloroflexota bacterium]MBI5348006.1 hypothetical protein [Chloroflexota bacterium]MBI5713868.1 hypothetical protein [Chloroflexota bacterium]
MPIPNLLLSGFLPIGLHLATLEEVKHRFGKETPQRQYLFERLKLFVDLATVMQSKRLFINGSYVTSKAEPGDVDVVIWLDDYFLRQLEAGNEKALSLEEMFLTRQPKETFAVFDEKGWQDWLEFFSRVRYRDDVRKGLVEITLR